MISIRLHKIISTNTMKSNFVLVLLGLLAIANQSCQNDDDDFIVDNEKNNITITAGIESSSTRTVIGGESGLETLWNENDKFCVFASENDYGAFTLTKGAGTSNGTFTGNAYGYGGSMGDDNTYLFENYVAYYPASKAKSIKYDSNKGIYSISSELPKEQVYQVNSYGCDAYPMACISPYPYSYFFSFKLLCSGLVWQFKKCDYTINRIMLESASKALNGDAITTMSKSIKPQLTITTSASEKANRRIELRKGGEGVNVDLAKAELTRFAFVIPSGTYPKDDLTLTIQVTNNKTNVTKYVGYRLTYDVTFEPGDYLDYGRKITLDF